MTTTLSIEDVTVRFGGTIALDSVTITVAPAGLTGLIGPNGAGKTTLFDAITGFVKPQSGRLSLDDHDITGLSPLRRARAGIRRSFQGAELFGDLTVRDNLVVAQPRRAKRDVGELLTRFRLEPYADTRAQDVPAGVQRIIGIARAFAGEPRVLLLDEPGAGLQAEEVSQLAIYLREMSHHDGITTLLVDHDMELIEEACDMVNVLDFGKLIARGTPAEIKRNTAVKEAYLGV